MTTATGNYIFVLIIILIEQQKEDPFITGAGIEDETYDYV